MPAHDSSEWQLILGAVLSSHLKLFISSARLVWLRALPDLNYC